MLRCFINVTEQLLKLMHFLQMQISADSSRIVTLTLL